MAAAAAGRESAAAAKVAAAAAAGISWEVAPHGCRARTGIARRPPASCDSHAPLHPRPAVCGEIACHVAACTVSDCARARSVSQSQTARARAMRRRADLPGIS